MPDNPTIVVRYYSIVTYETIGNGGIGSGTAIGIAGGIVFSTGSGTVIGIRTGIVYGIAIGTAFGIGIGISYEWAAEPLAVWFGYFPLAEWCRRRRLLRGRGGLYAPVGPTKFGTNTKVSSHRFGSTRKRVITVYCIRGPRAQYAKRSA